MATRILTLTGPVPAQIDRVGQILFDCFKTSRISLFHCDNKIDVMSDRLRADAACMIKKGWVDVLALGSGTNVGNTEGDAAIKPEDILGVIVYQPPGTQSSDITDWTSFAHRMSEQHNAYIANEWKAQDDRLKTEMPDPVPMRWVVYLAVDPAHRGQGYGRALLEDAKRKSIADGGSTVGLQVDMGEGPGYQLDFYPKCGFHKGESFVLDFKGTTSQWCRMLWSPNDITERAASSTLEE